MQRIYKSRDGKREIWIANGVQLPRTVKEKDQRTYNYLLRIEGANGQPYTINKTGISGNIRSRMITLANEYGARHITILWISPLYAESTARRLEWKIKGMAENSGWRTINKDRFIIPPHVEYLEIQVRKTYRIKVKYGAGMPLAPFSLLRPLRSKSKRGVYPFYIITPISRNIVLSKSSKC